MTALADFHDGAAVRVLLLARGHGNWWPALRRHLRTRDAGPLQHAFALTPDNALEGHTAEDIYVEAKVAFARRIRLLQQAGHGDDTWPDRIVADAPRLYGEGIEHAPPQPVIYHHIAALADVLAHANPEFALNDHPMEVLLANEVEYVRRIAEARLPEGIIDDELLRTLVAAQFLAGARTAQQGRAAVRAGYDAHHSGYGITAPPDARQLAAFDDVLTAAYPATDGAHWGAVGEPLAAAWLAEVEAESGEEFIEAFLQHDALATEQRHQTLSTVARTAQDQPALAAGAHRAVAADPERLLPLAAQTVTLELDTDDARQWLAGLEQAVADHAAETDIDPGIYEWAENFISDVQERTAADSDDLDELTCLLRTDEDDAEQSIPDSTPATSDTGSRLILVKPQVSSLIRVVATFLGACHLILVAAVPFAAALSTDIGKDGWVVWLFVPLSVSLHLVAASMFGARRYFVFPTAWIVPLVAVGYTTLVGLSLGKRWPEGWPPPWLVGPPLFALGLAALSFAWIITYGQFQDPEQAEAVSSL